VHLDTSYTIRPAGTGDLWAVLRLLGDATGWLADKGLDQWQGQGAARRRKVKVQTDIAAGVLFVVEHLGRVIATITVDEFADADFWKRKDRPRDALYVHRMAVARTNAGVGLGAAMLDWAAVRAERVGRPLLRLDAWATNTALHGYYRSLRFAHVRTEDVPGRGSGALFARPSEVRTGTGPVLVERPRALASGHLYGHRYGQRPHRKTRASAARNAVRPREAAAAGLATTAG
jgi:GNAT superfamily N-acetyltransferase